MTLLVRLGGIRGRSCSGPVFERAGSLQFRLCCGSDTAEYPRHEYIARGPQGGILYLSLNRANLLISCGRKGYHTVSESEPCI